MAIFRARELKDPEEVLNRSSYDEDYLIIRSCIGRDFSGLSPVSTANCFSCGLSSRVEGQKNRPGYRLSIF